MIILFAMSTDLKQFFVSNIVGRIITTGQVQSSFTRAVFNLKAQCTKRKRMNMSKKRRVISIISNKLMNK